MSRIQTGQDSMPGQTFFLLMCMGMCLSPFLYPLPLQLTNLRSETEQELTDCMGLLLEPTATRLC